jgi:peptide/nickel transport system permease protein
MSRSLFLLQRIAGLAAFLLFMAAFNFLLLSFAPGDAAEVLAGEAGAASPEYMAELRRQFGLDQPLPVRFVVYMRNVLSLNLGYSFRQGMPVSQLIAQRLPATLLLAGVSLAFAALGGALIGIVAARRKGRFADVALSTMALVFYATPVFWIGLLLVVVGSVKLGWFPIGGIETIGAGYTGWARVLDILWHLVLPALTLSLFFLAIYTRLTRASVIEVQGQDYIQTAIAKGLPQGRVTARHVLPNAILPLVTMAGLHIGSLLGGAVLVETVFSWPGLGRLAVDALFQRDLNLLLGILLCSSVVVVVANIVVEIVYRLLDPRMART